MSIRPAALGHLGLVAADLDRMVDFYCEVLGMEVSDWMTFPEESVFGRGAWIRCNAEHHVLSIFSLKDPESRQITGGQPGTWSSQSDARKPKPGLHHIAFQLSDFEDLRRAARYCRENGIEMQGSRKNGPGSQLRIYFWDPEENLIELFWAMDRIGWDGATRDFGPVEDIDIETFDVEEWLRMKGSMYKYEAVNHPVG